MTIRIEHTPTLVLTDPFGTEHRYTSWSSRLAIVADDGALSGVIQVPGGMWVDRPQVGLTWVPEGKDPGFPLVLIESQAQVAPVSPPSSKPTTRPAPVPPKDCTMQWRAIERASQAVLGRTLDAIRQSGAGPDRDIIIYAAIGQGIPVTHIANRLGLSPRAAFMIRDNTTRRARVTDKLAQVEAMLADDDEG